MPWVPHPPLLKHLPPFAWTVLAWIVATLYSIAAAPRLSAGNQSGFHAIRPEETFLIEAAAVTLLGSALLRRAPLAALGLLLAGSIAGTIAFYAPQISLLQFLPVDVALYLVAAHRSRRTSIAALALTIVARAGYAAAGLLTGFGAATPPMATEPLGDHLSTEFVVTLTGVISWFVGTSSRQSREYAAGLAARAATAERLRISRELHDSVAHSIGIIAVLAGAAGRVMETQPREAREALGSIEATSRDTLAGLQRMLRALRHVDPATGRVAVPLGPAPGLTDLDRLAAQASGAGVRVAVVWRGERRALPPEIDLSAFRIIQEAVTNVVRHSGTHACRVDVGFEPDELAIEVVDNGCGRTHGGHGHAVGGEDGFGLLGMRERVAMLSGRFSAGPRPEGGFRVAARLPT